MEKNEVIIAKSERVKNKSIMKKDDFFPDNQQLIVGPRSNSLTEPLAVQHLIAKHPHQLLSTLHANLAINPLVAAASSLFTLSTQLAGQTTPPNLSQLHSTLSHEVKLFENKVHALGYRAPIILAARYFLCAFIDEMILNTSWGKESDWYDKCLLQTFQRESDASERFFLILERSSEDPKLHIDLLELAYLCLSLGFEGKYREKDRSHHELRQVIDNVYHLIRYVRGDFSKRLFVSPQTAAFGGNSVKSSPKKSWKWSALRFPPAWIATAISLAALAGIYFPYHTHLTQLAEPVSHMIQDVPLSTEVNSE